MRPIRFLQAVILLAVTSASATLYAQAAPPVVNGPVPPKDAPGNDPYWGVWPSTDPKVVGTRLAMNLVGRPPDKRPQGVHYAEAGTAYGSLRFLQTIGNTELADKVVARFAPILTPAGKVMIPRPVNVDSSVFGIVPFEITRYLRTKKDPTLDATIKDYLDIGKNSADAQWARPANPSAQQATLLDAGLTTQTRWWIDDMFMITGLQMEAYRATGDKMYLDRTAKEMVAYLDRLQKPNGLFFHGEDAPFFWGRGDGWVAVGMAEVLLDLPEDHPNRARIMDGYKKMMAGLLQNQGTDGMWHQLIDKPETWAESSSTGMFTFAFGVGVRKGWLPEAQYKPAAKKAWIALCGYIDENANVREVCEGTGKGTTVEYYNARRRITGDFHGQCGAIWATWAMIADFK